MGDAKFYTMVNGVGLPPAKFATIAEYVWLLEKVPAKHKFVVFGNDRRVPEEWLKRYGRLISGVEFFFRHPSDAVERLRPRSTVSERERDEYRRLIERNLIEKLRRLPPERIAEVEDFIDFLHARQESRRLVNESLQLSEAAFQQVWNNQTTPTMIGCEFGEIILVPFPFTDQSTSKKSQPSLSQALSIIANGPITSLWR